MKRTLLFSLFSLLLYAQPKDLNIVNGTAKVDENNKLLEVTVSDQAILQWNSFSIDIGEITRFIQSSQNAAVVNKVMGDEISQLLGRLEANGRVYLINPQGIIVGPDGFIDCGSFIASTLDIDLDRFIEGNDLLFSGDEKATIKNLGTIVSKEGAIALLAHRIENEGTIEGSEVTLAAGHEILLKPSGDTILFIKPNMEDGGISNKGTIKALMSHIKKAGTASCAISGANLDATECVNKQGRIFLQANSGAIECNSTSHLFADKITMKGDLIFHMGIMQSPQGEITVSGKNFYQDGMISANNGSILMDLASSYIETKKGSIFAKEGSIDISSGCSFFSSGSFDVSGTCGGEISLQAKHISLCGSTINAQGENQGGKVTIGDKSSVIESIFVSGNNKIIADGAQSEVILYAKGAVQHHGTICANKGFVEISGKEKLIQTGSVSADHFLIDPDTIIIDTSGGYPQYQLIDPQSGSGSDFGFDLLPLSNGNVAVSKPGAGTAGAVFLFDGFSGSLISAVTGSAGTDEVSSGGLTELTNGNFVISSPSFGGTNGAATLVDGSSGLSGVVSSANSLVGFVAGDMVSSGGVTALTNGNYVVSSPMWDNGGAANAGAATWASGTTGITGTISSANSIVGDSSSDMVGSGGVTALSNGNFAVSSPAWNDGATTDVGAVSWGDGDSGTTGTVSTANSLTGSTASDAVSSGGIVALTGNGNFVVSSPDWDDGGTADVGAATWVDGSGPIMGAVGVGNSIIGSTASDAVSGGGITALSNGNFVVSSPDWDDGGTADVGAATWGDGSSGTTGVVAVGNSIIGSTASDAVSGGGITALTNGNFVVSSPDWDSGAIVDAGAATWGDGGSGTTGAVAIGNSLIGSQANDSVSSGGVTALTNGNFVVSSPDWDDGGTADVGAATWGDGSTGTTGAVAVGNSLIGSQANDAISGGGITALTNGNFVVSSPDWDDGGTADAGAATLGDGSAGTTGVVSAANSLIGGAASDAVGSDGATALENGNFVVVSTSWSGGLGAVTLGNGSTGIIDTVGAMNSLIGASAGDAIGSGGITALSSGDYVVASPAFDGAFADNGAATFGDGTSGVTGTVTADNSVTGGAASTTLSTVVDDSVNQSFLAPFLDEGTGTVRVGLQSADQLTAGRAVSQTVTLSPTFIEDTLAGGTSITLESGSDVLFSSPLTVSGAAPPGTSFNVTAGQDITITADMTMEAVDLNLTADRDLLIDNLATITSSSGDILLIAGESIIGSDSVSIFTTGASSTLTLVADNLFPSSPDFGTGFISFPSNATICTNSCAGGGNLRLYTVTVSGNFFPATMNGATVPGTFQTFETYFPEGEGGVPFQIFYKQSLLGSFSSSVELFQAAINDSFPEAMISEEEEVEGNVRSSEGLSTTNPSPCQG